MRTLARSWRLALIVAYAAASVVVVALSIGHRADNNASPAATPEPDAPVILMGLHGRISDPFFLGGGSYRATWSAWGEMPNEPPCTHSMALLPVDPGAPTNQIMELAKSVQVPYTGTTAVIDMTDVNPGDYYLQITSACAWQIELRARRS
jgi:hypothetical protein